MHVPTWKVTLSLRTEAAHGFDPSALAGLAFLNPTIEETWQPTYRIVTLTVKAVAADVALDYGHHRTAGALAILEPLWQIECGAVQALGDCEAAADRGRREAVRRDLELLRAPGPSATASG